MAFYWYQKAAQYKTWLFIYNKDKGTEKNLEKKLFISIKK